MKTRGFIVTAMTSCGQLEETGARASNCFDPFKTIKVFIQPNKLQIINL
jgi:hypothetical protein